MRAKRTTCARESTLHWIAHERANGVCLQPGFDFHGSMFCRNLYETRLRCLFLFTINRNIFFIEIYETNNALK